MPLSSESSSRATLSLLSSEAKASKRLPQLLIFSEPSNRFRQVCETIRFPVNTLDTAIAMLSQTLS
jgi:hypothetical protein